MVLYLRPDFNSVTWTSATTESVEAPTQSSLVLKYVTIPLDDVVNASLTDDFADPPIGSRILGEVPFELNGMAFKTQAQSPPWDRYPTIEIGLSNVEYVFALISAGNGLRRWEHQTIGSIELTFDGKSSVIVQLVLGKNVREWHESESMVSSASNIQQVWTGSITGYPDLVGTLDMVTVHIPMDQNSSTLAQINI